MFGGGAKKEKKEEDEDRGETSGSAKAQREAAAEENPEVRSTAGKIRTQTLIMLRTGRSPRIRGCSLRARHPPHREGRSQDKRGDGGADLQDAREAVQVHPRVQRVEGAWNW